MSASSSLAHRKLPGPDNFRARKLYYTLKFHHKLSECLVCTSYVRYGCSIVKGNLLEHVRDLVTFPVVMSDLTKLQEVGMIEIEQITTNRHRIVFVELAPKEITA